MVIQPDKHDFQWVMLLPLALVLVSTVFQLLTSYLVRHDDPGTMNFLTGKLSPNFKEYQIISGSDKLS